jgi:hypothetical protein
MNQVVKKSFRPCIGSYALRETYRQSKECTLFSKAIGTAGSGLESYFTRWGQETHIVIALRQSTYSLQQ